MRLLEEVEIKLDVGDISKPPLSPVYPDYEVIPGCVGVATLLRSIALKLKMVEDRDEDVQEIPLRMALGMGWEWWAARLYPEMQWQPGVMRLGGVVGHPDGLSFVNGIWAVEEFKYTHKTARDKKIQDQWLWCQQVGGYMNLVNKTDYLGAEVRLGRFHVCYGLGDYTRPYKEKYVRYLVEYSEEDLDRNWAMISKEREKMGL